MFGTENGPLPLAKLHVYRGDVSPLGGGPHFLTTEYNAISTWLRCAHAGIVQNKKHQLTNERLKQSDCTAAERTIAVYKTVTRYLCERQQEAQLSLKPNAQRKNQLSSTVS